MSRARYVYFIKPVGMPGPVKIGCSDKPGGRISALQTWSPFPLEIVATVPGDLKLERAIHDYFAEQFSHREWFVWSAELQRLIDGLKGGQSVADIIDLNKPSGSIRSKRRQGRTVYTPERRMRVSYAARVRNAEKRRRDRGCPDWKVRDDIQAILDRWAGNPYRRVPGIIPSADEIALIDLYLSDPASHSVVPQWQRKIAA